MKRDRRNRTGICSALPFRQSRSGMLKGNVKSAAPECHVDMARTQHDALDLQNDEIAVAEFPCCGPEGRSPLSPCCPGVGRYSAPD